MFFKRIITRSGGCGVLKFPKEMVGEEVFVVSKGATMELQELVEKTLLYRRIDREDQKKRDERVDVLERELLFRIQRLENCVYGTKQYDEKKQK